QKVLREANIHYYANALMNFSYAYIDQKLKEKGLPPQLKVPHLRFVQAGVFVVMAQSFKHVKSSNVAPDRSFLIEEQIDIPEGDSFTKFIHNGSAEPNLLPDDPACQTCLFLCACQHLQYSKTHHMAFVSDLQGCNGLLTDAQIMTSLKPMVFGEGNIESCFAHFLQEHQCNEFCLWMDLAPLCVEDQVATDELQYMYILILVCMLYIVSSV
ncbi:hypothetical protein GYMLUDRAFT_166365, partial [Collybiopsis luxurians FD-317 M1]